MTIKECQEEHKKLWNWIADETERTRKLVHKKDYFKEMNIQRIPRLNCFACEYDKERNDEWIDYCTHCPILWNKEQLRYAYRTYCKNLVTSPYREWLLIVRRTDYDIELEKETLKELVSLAREIANLPFKEDEL